MATPYRSSGGTPCPRCREVLTRESDDELNCANGCGTWLGKKLIETMVAMETVAKSSGNPFRATPLPPTKCMVCRKPLNDLYKGTVDVLTIGQCMQHGVWLERADRAMFEALYRPDIAAHERAIEAAQARAVEHANLDPRVIKLIERVEQLEAEVLRLRRELDVMRDRMP